MALTPLEKKVRSWLSTGAAGVALIGSLYAGWLALDTRYAKASEVSQQFQVLEDTIREGQRQQLRREEFELLREKKRRPLTDLEESRLLEVQDAIKALDKKRSP